MQGKNCKGLVSLIANGLASRTPFALSRRYFFVLFLRVLCVLGGEALVSGQLAHAMEVADTVFINGKIITVDERFTIAHALAIKGDRIIDVGTTPQIRKLAGANTKVVDLKGKTVIPGLIDNHAHFMRSEIGRAHV